MQDKYVINCPFCGGTEVIESYQSSFLNFIAKMLTRHNCLVENTSFLTL